MSSVESLSSTTVTAASPSVVESNESLLLTPPYAPSSMSVTKRNGRREPVDLNKIVRAVQRCSDGLYAVDPMRVATRTISGLYDGASTRELDDLSIRTAALLTAEEPEYSRLAARLLAAYIDKEVSGQEIHAFSQSISRGHELGLINARLLTFVQTHARKLNAALNSAFDRHFDYFGLRTVYDRYLLRHPHTRKVIETPQQFFCASPVRSVLTLPKRWPCISGSAISTTCPARRLCSMQAPPTSNYRVAFCSTRRRIRCSRFTNAMATSPSSANSVAASACRGLACVRVAR